MFKTPNGIAIVEVANIGTGRTPGAAAAPGTPGGASVEIVASRARGGYFARRTREIYYTGSGSGTVTAVNIDTKRTREVWYARGIINADETLSVVKNGNAVDPEGKYPRPPARPLVPQLQRMFRASRWQS
jgi:hypothetical protein